MTAIGYISIQPDGRITVVTEDGAATSAKPITIAVEPETQDWLDSLPAASTTIEYVLDEDDV